MIDGEKRKVDKLIGRRKLKKDYEYEVQWQGLGPDKNVWINRDDLVSACCRTKAMAFRKHVGCRPCIMM